VPSEQIKSKENNKRYQTIKSKQTSNEKHQRGGIIMTCNGNAKSNQRQQKTPQKFKPFVSL
jgi:hypothetical protein